MSYYATAQSALYQWGAWVARPTRWADLRIVPAWALLPMVVERQSRHHEPKVDQFSRRIHEAIKGLGDERAQVVLVGYYARHLAWDRAARVYKAHHVGRSSFYAILRESSVRVYNVARSG
jgi:hypothetical protein